MYLLGSTRAHLSRLYNNRFKTKIGFFIPGKALKETGSDFSRLTIQNRIENDGRLSNSKIANYGIFVPNERLRLELLHQSITQILNKWPDYKVCIYANGYRTNQVLKSSKIIQRFPANKHHQLHFRRAFRRGPFLLLLSDNMFAKLPKVDMVIHYDLPGTQETFLKRLMPTKANLFLYGRSEKLFVAQLQNYLNVVVHEWPMPSTQSLVESFLNQIETIFENEVSDHSDSPGPEQSEHQPLIGPQNRGNRVVDTLLSKGTGGDEDRFDKKSVLASLLYMLHHKLKGVKRRQYLLRDPNFKVFKSREAVIKYLNENGVIYNSVSLCKEGFLIEAMSEVSLPGTRPVLKYKRLTRHIARARRLIRSSYLSSPISKRKYFKNLVKEHERKIISSLRNT